MYLATIYVNIFLQDLCISDSKLENYCRALFNVGADLASSAIHPYEWENANNIAFLSCVPILS